jgi:hypothetical protein
MSSTGSTQETRAVVINHAAPFQPISKLPGNRNLPLPQSISKSSYGQSMPITGCGTVIGVWKRHEILSCDQTRHLNLIKTYSMLKAHGVISLVCIPQMEIKQGRPQVCDSFIPF